MCAELPKARHSRFSGTLVNVWPFRACGALLLSAVVDHGSSVAIILVHALNHHPDAQAKAQDEVVACRDAADFALCIDHFFEE